MTRTAPVAAPVLQGLSLADYRIAEIAAVRTPALAIYMEIVDANIAATLRLLDGDGDRWRPHVKTAKLARVMERFVAHGIRNFKCSTSLELKTVCAAGAADVLLAYPVIGANARRVRELAAAFPQARISALVEAVAQIEVWRDSPVGLFIDVNTGMNRTGIEQQQVSEVVELARAMVSAGLEFRGLHYYDGHMASVLDIREREALAHSGYDRLLELVAAIEEAGIAVGEVITAGTPAFPCSLTYPRFQQSSFTHRISPGTIVYNDCTSLLQLPAAYGYRPAALVVATVVSQPMADRLTCDAGHKTVSADAGTPNCFVIGHAKLLPQKPSEEHLPIESASPAEKPAIGEVLYLVPKHVCPTVNNFDDALIIEGGRVVAVEKVTARGREAPLERE